MSTSPAFIASIAGIIAGNGPWYFTLAPSLASSSSSEPMCLATAARVAPWRIPRLTVTPWVEALESLAVVAPDEPESEEVGLLLVAELLLPPPPQAASARDIIRAARMARTAAGR